MQANLNDPNQSRIDILKGLIGRLTRPEITLAEARSVREEMGRMLELGASRPARDIDPIGPPALGPVA